MTVIELGTQEILAAVTLLTAIRVPICVTKTQQLQQTFREPQTRLSGISLHNKNTSRVINDLLQDWEAARQCPSVDSPRGSQVGALGKEIPVEYLICPAGSPFQFVSSGLEVEPFHSVPLIGLVSSSSYDRTSCQNDKLTLASVNGLGKLWNSVKFDMQVPMRGEHTRQMELSINDLDDAKMNALLEGLIYESITDVIDEWDTVTVEFCGSILNIHIHIRRQLPSVPKTSPPIHDRVTILVKTFERYDKLNKLIDSISQFYPEMTILVADDSVKYQTVDRKNVRQYKMPSQTGWFAGRNLLVSQVTTEYFVWTDDNFVFKDRTTLDLFVERLDKLELNLDVIAGPVDGIVGCNFCLRVDSGKEGHCISTVPNCHRGKLDGYPNCVLVDRPTNFFMSRTTSAQRVGFDTDYELAHVGHNGFFLDGQHTLNCACCSDVSVGHE